MTVPPRSIAPVPRPRRRPLRPTVTVAVTAADAISSTSIVRASRSRVALRNASGGGPGGTCCGGAAQSTPRTLHPAQQRVTHVAARPDARRDGPQAGADVLDVLVERVVGAEAVLQRDERRRVAHEGQEEQAGVELAEALEAVGERVAAAQDLDAVVDLGVREVDVAVGRQRLGPDGLELVAAAERRADDLRAPQRLLLGLQRRAVPDLDEHPDAPRDEVGAAAQPVGLAGPGRAAADPDVAVELVDVLELEVGRAVLEPHEVARRGLRTARGR